MYKNDEILDKKRKNVEKSEYIKKSLIILKNYIFKKMWKNVKKKLIK